MALPEIRLLRLAFLLLIRWPVPTDLCLTLPVAVIFTLLAIPLCVFCFGIRFFPESIIHQQTIETKYSTVLIEIIKGLFGKYSKRQD
jgi:hypothetical protein